MRTCDSIYGPLGQACHSKQGNPHPVPGGGGGVEAIIDRRITVNDSKAIDKSIVFELSAKRRKIGCRCFLDDGRKELVRCSFPIAYSNRFRGLKNDDVTIKKRGCVGVPQSGLQSRSAYHREYGLRVGSWNLSGLCQRKQKEISDILNKLKLDL